LAGTVTTFYLVLMQAGIRKRDKAGSGWQRRGGWCQAFSASLFVEVSRWNRAELGAWLGVVSGSFKRLLIRPLRHYGSRRLVLLYRFLPKHRGPQALRNSLYRSRAASL